MHFFDNKRINLSSVYSNASFIGVNIFVAFVGFARSLAFAKFFDFKELGTITLIITAVMLIGFFQIGLINGGYRIIALNKTDVSEKTNNVIFSYFGTLTVFLLVIFSLGSWTGWLSNPFYSIIILIVGILALVVNWLTNTLIGSREYKKLNLINIISASASLISIIFAYIWGVYGAVLSLIVQPILFICLVFLLTDSKIPLRFDLDVKHIKYILSFGFVPFLSGMFYLAYVQIERWSINSTLGEAALGKMYIFFIVTTLWNLIPSSINSLFFPRTVKLFSGNDLKGLRRSVYMHFISLAIYCLFGVLAIFFTLSYVVKFLFPLHLSFVYLVMISAPGLVLRTMTEPMGVFLNSIVKLRYIFMGDAISMLIYISYVFILIITESISLKMMVFGFVMNSFIKFCFVLFGFIEEKKNLKTLRYDV